MVRSDYEVFHETQFTKWLDKVVDRKVMDFIAESNAIEGIDSVQQSEIEEFYRFLNLDKITVEDLAQFVSVYQPGAKLRTKKGMDVRIGNHIPPAGSVNMTSKLQNILVHANEGTDPYEVHQMYESLHPFLDGNGRSGRMLWAWQMVNQKKYAFTRGFLHQWYYQSLDNRRKV